ncbi:uncharacterized protein [Eleutherodactylus coqui]|uniref:uncharacterized protein n=1 Tax=Eleutherodactylus coqui TaxID=57060 RepID=UPI003461A4F3
MKKVLEEEEHFPDERWMRRVKRAKPRYRRFKYNEISLWPSVEMIPEEEEEEEEEEVELEEEEEEVELEEEEGVMDIENIRKETISRLVKKIISYCIVTICIV